MNELNNFIRKLDSIYSKIIVSELNSLPILIFR